MERINYKRDFEYICDWFMNGFYVLVFLARDKIYIQNYAARFCHRVCKLQKVFF